MRVIATRTDDDHGLIEEQEFISDNEDLKSIYIEFGWVKPYDDTKVLPPKGMNDYELKSYPKDRFIVKDGNMYKSNTITSETFVLSEWDLKIQGA